MSMDNDVRTCGWCQAPVMTNDTENAVGMDASRIQPFTIWYHRACLATAQAEEPTRNLEADRYTEACNATRDMFEET